MPWNPDQHNKFRAERTAPFFDLLALVDVRPELKVVDLGCGTGELTRRLADQLPGSDVLGLDRSMEMLSKSVAFARPGLRFEQGQIEKLQGQWDLIFSNAALQWLDHHETRIPALWNHLNPGGQLVVQMPTNHDHPSHLLARELAEGEPFRAFFPEGGRKPPVLPVEDYAEMLYDLGAVQITALMKVYPHVLEDASSIVEWVKGTLLVPYLERLPAEYVSEFLSLYTRQLSKQLPQKPVFYGFMRVLFAATKP